MQAEISAGAWSSAVEAGDGAERDAISRILDIKATTKAKHVTAVVSSYLDQCKTEGKGRVSPHLVQAVVERCTAKDKAPVWADEALSLLIRTGAVSARACAGLLQAILDQNAAEALAMSLVHVSDISEVELVAVMRHVLRAGDDGAALDAYYRNTVCKGRRDLKACMALS